MKRLYIDKEETGKVLRKITDLQTRKNCFINVSVKPYRGEKYNRENTVVVTMGR